MKIIDADGSFTINASDNTGYSLAFGGGIISCADESGHIEAEFFTDDIPTVKDVAPVRHGWWLHSHYEDCSEHFEIVKCSNCDFEAYAMAFFVRSGNYCPNCGARMDGARNGEED